MLRDKLFDELNQYLRTEKFEKPRTIINAKQLFVYKSATLGERKEIKHILEGHRLSKGTYAYGYRIYYDPATMDIKTEDVHIVTVEVVNKRNRPMAIATFNDNITMFVCGNKTFRRTVINNPDGTVRGIPPIKLSMPAVQMDDVFYRTTYFVEGDNTPHKTDYHMIRFGKCEVETFYSFDNVSCVKFTDAMKRKYWETSDLTLKRHEVNLSTHSNGWGLIFPTWTDTIIEVDGAVYTSDTITKEEVEMVTKGYEESWVSEQLIRKFKALTNNDEEDKSAKKKKMEDYVNSIQAVVSSHAEEILDQTIANLRAILNPTISLASKDDRITAKKAVLAAMEPKFGLDCGFLYFKFEDKEMDALAREANTYGSSVFLADGTFTLNIPYYNQSTTIMGQEARVIRDLVRETKLPKISFRTVLD